MSGGAPTALRPTGLTVLYDARCPVCRQARKWVEARRHLVPVRFVPAGSPLAAQRFPQLDAGRMLTDVTVVTDEGAVVRGDEAWIAVLWAVARTRPLAVRLAHGDGRWMLRNVKGATEAIRRVTRAVPDPGLLGTGPLAVGGPLDPGGDGVGARGAT